MRPHKPQPKFAVCIDNSDYPVSLDLHKVYRVLPDDEAVKHGDLRVIDESGDDYLYPADYFVLIPVSQQVARVLNSSFAQNAQDATPEPVARAR